MRRYVALACAVLLTGCSYSTVFQNPSGNLVQAGMTKEQVRAAWGEPVEEHADLPQLSIVTDAWKYEFATVFFIQNNIVNSIMPAVTPGKNVSPRSDMAGGRR